MLQPRLVVFHSDVMVHQAALSLHNAHVFTYDGKMKSPETWKHYINNEQCAEDFHTSADIMFVVPEQIYFPVHTQLRNCVSPYVRSAVGLKTGTNKELAMISILDSYRVNRERVIHDDYANKIYPFV